MTGSPLVTGCGHTGRSKVPAAVGSRLQGQLVCCRSLWTGKLTRRFHPGASILSSRFEADCALDLLFGTAMSAASSRGGGSGLDSLLAGVDPRFNRPSMQDMKAKGGTSKFAGTSQLRPNSSPPNPPATSPAPAAAVAAGGGSVFGLEHLLQPRSSPPQVQQR